MKSQAECEKWDVGESFKVLCKVTDSFSVFQ